MQLLPSAHIAFPAGATAKEVCATWFGVSFGMVGSTRMRLTSRWKWLGRDTVAYDVDESARRLTGRFG